MLIRKATQNDAEALCELYSYHLNSSPPKEPQDMTRWREMLAGFEHNPAYNILVGEFDGRIVSSVTIVLIDNLTRNMKPYAVIENVVTHSNNRGNGFAVLLMNYASKIAEEYGCYKIMLLSGSKTESTLHFYERCGFNRNDKTAFIKWLAEI